MVDSTPAQPARTSRMTTIIHRVKASIKKRLSKLSKRSAADTEAQREAGLPSAQHAVNSPSTLPAPLEITPDLPKAAEPITFRTTVDKEKIQALFAKYGLEFDGDTVLVSAVDKTGNRVQKSIRMRVRRECHTCQSTFSRSLSCAKCGHRFCRECKRYPPKKSKDKSTVKIRDTPQDVNVPASPG